MYKRFGGMCCFQYCVHHILHHTTSILGKKSWCRGWFVRKAVYIKLHPDNVNLEHRYSLSMSLKKREQQILSEDKTALSPSGNIHLHMPSYTGCPRRNVPDFRRVFLMLKYTDITQNTYIQS